MPAISPAPALRRGSPTATDRNVSYRLGRFAEYIGGTWLDFGCADGGYVNGLLARGAFRVIGVDVEGDRIDEAQARGLAGAEFHCFDGRRLPLEDASVDGAFVNEVLEHVEDESAALSELRRVLRPDGVLVVMSPNRWFPFEGHGSRFGKLDFGPTFLLPWLPKRLTRRFVFARNYWPHELRSLVAAHGFDVISIGFVLPVFEQYPWLPESIQRRYRASLERLDDIPVLRRFGVSTLVVARPSLRRGSGARPEFAPASTEPA